MVPFAVIGLSPPVIVTVVVDRFLFTFCRLKECLDDFNCLGGSTRPAIPAYIIWNGHKTPSVVSSKRTGCGGKGSLSVGIIDCDVMSKARPIGYVSSVPSRGNSARAVSSKLA